MNTGVDCYAFPQGISPTQGSDLSLLLLMNRQMDSLPLAPPGNVHVWLNFFAVHLKLLHCLLISSTSIQNKKLKKSNRCVLPLKSVSLKGRQFSGSEIVGFLNFGKKFFQGICNGGSLRYTFPHRGLFFSLFKNI